MKSSKPPSSSKPSSSSSRKSRWEAAGNAPSTPKDNTNLSKPSNPRKEPDNKAASSPSSAPAPAAGVRRGGPPPLYAGWPHLDAPAPPTYGFQNLERRTMLLADGSARSYFALPPDYPLEPYGHGGRQDPRLGLGFDRFSPDRFREPPPPRDFGLPMDYWGPLEGGFSSMMKRKFPEDDEFAWHRQHAAQFGNPNPNLNLSPMRRGFEDDLRASKQAKLEERNGYEEFAARRGRGAQDLAPEGPAVIDVDPQAMKRAFIKFVKMINETAAQKKNYLEDGKNGPLKCLACGRASEEFSDVHGLIMHMYTTENPDLRVDHLGLHKALCVLMGWNYAKAPDNSKAYQSFSADDASANREDLIIWPPTVIIHNTRTGKREDGRVEGMGNIEMDMRLKDLGFGGGKSKALYGKEGHLGIMAVKFAHTEAGLMEADRLAEYFEKESHGRRDWARVQASHSGDDEENNTALVKVELKSGDKKRILYGYLATAFDLDKFDFDTRKRAIIKSRRELDPSE